MKANFGKQRLDIRVVLLVGLILGLAFLWIVWPRCAPQAPCSCQNQVVSNMQPQAGTVLNKQEEEIQSPQFMSDISFSRVIGNQAITDKGSTTRIISAGERFFRRESPADLEWGRKDLFIKNQSDNWIINLFNRYGVHFESSAQPALLKVPLAYSAAGFKGDLLVGEEAKFFIENGAQKTIAGTGVTYELKITDGKLRLIVDLASDKPVRIDVINDASPMKSQSVIYENFERRLKFDPQVFQAPSGLMIKKWDLKVEKPVKYGGWSSEDPELLNYYLKPDPQALLAAFEKLPSAGIPEIRQPFIELSAAILKREKTLIPSFVKVAKQANPDFQIWAALALRSCKTEDCLSVLKTNPFGFIEEGFKEFIGEDKPKGDGSSRRVFRGVSVDQHLADFIVTGDKESLGQVISFLDSRIEIGGGQEQSVGRPAGLDTAPPGVVDLMKKFALSDPTVKDYLKNRQEAKSRSAGEILNQLS